VVWHERLYPGKGRISTMPRSVFAISEILLGVCRKKLID
jgi:hypothetical protein